MSRWGVEAPARDAFLYALDPETVGEPLSEKDSARLVKRTARMHARRTLEGLGYDELSKSALVQPSDRRQAVEFALGDEGSRQFIGAVASPFGLLPLSVSQAQDLQSSLPTDVTNRFFFVGLDFEVVDDLLSGRVLRTSEFRRSDDRTRIGPDGLIVAPISRVDPIAVKI